jgi:diadenosine tetraphosphate (Ap4A) HIT family hydrolase
MPTLISRDEALRRIMRDAREPACLMCAIAERKAGPVHVVYEDDELLVSLPSYVRRWGAVMVMPKLHVIDYDSVCPELWARTSRFAHQAARMVERVQRPRRCYLASTGSNSAVGELTQSSRHLHIHVIPIYESDDRPASVFSWSEGVYVGEPDEWADLLGIYREEWKSCAW